MSARLLIVDDEPNIRLMLRTVLVCHGYVVSEAASGRQALETLKREPIDLVLLDLNMPEIDGIGVLRELRLWPPQQRPRVIVLTAFGSVPLAVEATHLGAADFLEKPVTPEDLRLSVAGVLSSPREPIAEPDPTSLGTIARARVQLARGAVGDAESLLMRAAEQADCDPAYFNLLGVVYEAEGRRRLAMNCYSRALKVDSAYAAARSNLQRLREIDAAGHSELEIMLGDETSPAR
jgi:DNA-binding response OmpR family regulator